MSAKPKPRDGFRQETPHVVTCWAQNDPTQRACCMTGATVQRDRAGTCAGIGGGK